MKTALTVSVLVNLGLAGCLCFFASQRVGENSRPPAVIQAAATVSVSPAAKPRPFQWNQLLSLSDYTVYIKNLRRAGCPEATVYDIVAGDADRAFSTRRVQLNLDGSGSGPWSQIAEKHLIAKLLGYPDNSETTAATAASQDPEQDAPAAAYPLVLQNVNLDTLGMNADQKQAVAEIRQQFIDEIGGTNQNPDDPAYLERWEKAQSESDDTLKSMVGTTIFENYQLSAAGN